MSVMSNKDVNRKSVVEALKACGTCIIENADSMVGYELYRCGLSVTIDILPGEAPVIHINKDVYPEALFGDSEIRCECSEKDGYYKFVKERSEQLYGDEKDK